MKKIGLTATFTVILRPFMKAYRLRAIPLRSRW